MTKVFSVGASGKLGRYMVQHALARGYEVVGVFCERRVGKLDAFRGRITVIPGFTNDRAVTQRAVAGCNGVHRAGLGGRAQVCVGNGPGRAGLR